MPRYDFTKGAVTKEIMCPMWELPSRTAELAVEGWARVYSPPNAVIVRGGYWDYYNQYAAEEDKNDREGKTVTTDNYDV